MAALDLSTITQLPFVSSGVSSTSTNKCRIILLPTTGRYRVTVHNIDKATKDLRLSTDQTLVDEGAAPATACKVDDPRVFLCGSNRESGFARITQLAIFSTAHTSINFDVCIEERT